MHLEVIKKMTVAKLTSTPAWHGTAGCFPENTRFFYWHIDLLTGAYFNRGWHPELMALALLVRVTGNNAQSLRMNASLISPHPRETFVIHPQSKVSSESTAPRTHIQIRAEQFVWANLIKNKKFLLLTVKILPFSPKKHFQFLSLFRRLK